MDSRWICSTMVASCLERTKIDFLSPQVDNQLQGILAKAPVHSSLDVLRNAQLVKARVIWSTKPAPVVPVLAVTRLGGQAFVFVATEQRWKVFCPPARSYAWRHDRQHLCGSGRLAERG